MRVFGSHKTCQKSPKATKVCQCLPKLANCEFSPNPWSGPKVTTGGWGGWLGSPFWAPLLLTVNCSYFALFFIIRHDLGLFIDVSCSSWSNLAFWCYAAILGGLITASQHKNQHPRHTSAFSWICIVNCNSCIHNKTDIWEKSYVIYNPILWFSNFEVALLGDTETVERYCKI